MKKTSIIVLVCSFIIILVGCGSGEIKEEDKYMINALYSYGAYKEDLEKTKISYEVIISGTEEDIENIDSYDVLINMNYLDLMLENGPHSSKKEVGEESYAKITGSFVFDTKGKSKEEIDNMKLLEGVEVIDKDKNEVVIKFSSQ